MTTVTVKGKTYQYKDMLRSDGFLWDPSDQSWKRESAPEEIDRCLRVYGRRGLHVSTDEPEYCRSSGYRKTFLDETEGKPLRCVYCGRKLDQRTLSVDHLFPVGAVNGSPRAYYNRRRMHFYGIDNINDGKNLVPSCQRCNSRKGKKTGIWVLRGKLGGYPWFRPLLWTLYSAFAAALLTILIMFL